MVGDRGVLIELSSQSNESEVQLWAVKCLEAIAFVKDEQKVTNYPNKEKYLELCSKIFLRLILEERQPNLDEIIFCKVIIFLTLSVDYPTRPLRSLQSFLPIAPYDHSGDRSQCSFLTIAFDVCFQRSLLKAPSAFVA